MRITPRALVSAVVGGLVAGGAAAEPQTTGPVAVYWVSAATSSGMAGLTGMPGMGAPGGPPTQAPPQRRPGLGAMIGSALAGGGPPPGYGGAGPRGAPGAFGGFGGGPSRELVLQLGSSQRPTAGARADHLPPTGLGAGPDLPLLTPRVARPEPPEPGVPQMPAQRPRGRMLIYWGCGEHAAPPVVIDFSRIGPGAPMPNIPMVAANPGRPPSPGRQATYGDWPNEEARTTVPPDGSLVGAHVVRGNYSPEIRFSLGADQDFLAPLEITGMDRSPGGGQRVSWSPVAGATGYFAWMMGAQERGDTIVVWSSAGAANMMGGVLADYLPPAEVRRLIGQGMVLPPQTTQCVVPSEVIKAAPNGMLSMIAYGEETDFVDPPRPRDPKVAWNMRWTVKVRRKSTTSTILGMPAGGRGF